MGGDERPTWEKISHLCYQLAEISELAAVLLALFGLLPITPDPEKTLLSFCKLQVLPKRAQVSLLWSRS